MICSRCKKEIPEASAFCCHCGKRQIAAPSPQRRQRRRPKGTGTVYRMPGNRARPWAARDSEGNFIGGYETCGAAVQALDAYNATLVPTDRKSYTLANVFNSLQHSQKWAKLGAKGQEGLLIAWKRLEPLAGRRALTVAITEYQDIIDNATVAQRHKTLSPVELANLSPVRRKRYESIAAKPPQPLGYDGKNRIKQLVSHLYNEMIRLQITDVNLSNQLILPSQPTGTKRNFTRQEKELLIQHDGEDAAKIIIIFLGTGMRLGELLTLPRKNVDLDHRVITGGNKTAAGRNRKIPILDNVCPYVQYFYERGGEYLIEESGKPITEDKFRRQYFYPTLQKLGIKYKDESGKNILTPHRTRHTTIADAIKEKVDPVALTKAMGHSKFSVTVDKYADDIDPEYIRRELSKIGN